MRDDQMVEVESTELLRTLIKNACVNDGSAESGQEARSVDALEDFFAGSHNERVDVGSLRLSAEMWEALCRDFLA